MTKDHFIPVSHQKNFSLPLPLIKKNKEIRYGKVITKRENTLNVSWTTTRNFGYQKNLNSGIQMPLSGISLEEFLAYNFDTLSSELNLFWKTSDKAIEEAMSDGKKGLLKYDSIELGRITMYVYVLILRHPKVLLTISKEIREYILLSIEKYVADGKLFMPPLYGLGLLAVKPYTAILPSSSVPLVKIKDFTVAYVPFKPNSILIIGLDPQTDFRELSQDNHENNYRSILTGQSYYSAYETKYHEDTYLMHPEASLEDIKKLIYPRNFTRKKVPKIVYNHFPKWLPDKYREYI